MHRLLALLVPVGLSLLAACSGPSQAPTPTTAVAKPAATAVVSSVPSVSPVAVVSPVASPAVAPVASPAVNPVASPAVAPVASPAVNPAASPVASPAVAVPSPSAIGATTVASSGPTPAATVGTPEMVWIGNTDGAGVYLRNTPVQGDRAGVLADGTQVTITGGQVEGDGLEWYPITTSDGQQGFVPIAYLTRAEPEGAPTAPTGDPK